MNSIKLLCSYMFISCVFIFSLQRFKYTTGSSSTAFLCHGWLHNKEWQEARCSGGCCGVGDTAGCRGRHKCRHHEQGGHQEERQEGAAGHGPQVSIHEINLYWGCQFRMFRTNSSWKRTTRCLPMNAAGLICRSNRKATATSWGLSARQCNGGNRILSCSTVGWMNIPSPPLVCQISQRGLSRNIAKENRLVCYRIPDDFGDFGVNQILGTNSMARTPQGIFPLKIIWGWVKTLFPWWTSK